jgi:adenylate kinase
MSLYLIIMGVQGAGKGTQAAFISERFNIPHISTGDLFRAMKTRTDELAQRVQHIMEAGQLVSDDVTNEVLQDRLAQPDAANGVILDGYPRNIEQAEWLDRHLTNQGECLSRVLLLDLDFYTAFKRAYGRVKSAQTGKTYNVYFDRDRLDVTFDDHPEKAFPPRMRAVLKATGEELERRADDEAASVVKRIDIFRETTQPLIDYYREKGLLVEIDASESIQAVSQAVEAAIAEAIRHQA